MLKNEKLLVAEEMAEFVTDESVAKLNSLLSVNPDIMRLECSAPTFLT